MSVSTLSLAEITYRRVLINLLIDGVNLIVASSLVRTVTQPAVVH